MKVGYFLSCEEFGPRELVAQARGAQAAGFSGLWISDHYHPWTGAQGNSPFVWGVIGALSEATSLPVTTAVTCPTRRIHPAVVAQAAATAAVQLEGRFALGVGTGEALNEHIFGDRWPSAAVRLEMLEEAIGVIRRLWTGKQVSHRGPHYTVENARLYTAPEAPPPVYVSGFGAKSIDLAARIGDGYCLVTPDPGAVRRFREAGGTGVVQAGAKVCFGRDEAACRATARKLWPNEAIPGELPMILPTPAHFEQAAELVTEEMVADSVVCGPDLDRHLALLHEYADAGVDEVFVQQVGGEHEAFFAAYRDEVLPRL
ncbi:MAG: TIGR03557 family F420-dependent LLM class oxidoreductase [Solirubrobacterales bacterium]|nr:TIGR03557 family F420-dependent LLM class oxidoreductase [Solirubrobacterales bacterium]